MGVKEMSKSTVDEKKTGEKKEDLDAKVEEGNLEKKPEQGKEEVAESKAEEKVESKVEKAEIEPKVEEKQDEKGKAQVAVEEKVEPEKKEIKEGDAKVEEVAEAGSAQGSKIGEIIGTIGDMTVLELSNLVKALEEKFGVIAVAPAAAGVATAAPVEEAKEKTEWSVILTAIGEKKIQVIKEVRAVTNLGLKEAKTLVEEAPKPVKEGVPQKEAEEVKAKLEAAGATVELK